MNMSSELGISPVLLQAISEKISSKDSKMDPTFIKQEMIDNHDNVSQNEASCDPIMNQDVSQILPDIVNSVQQRISMEGSNRTITADDIRQLISLKLAQQAQQQISQNSDGQNSFAVNQPNTTTDTSMMNFLSNVAATQTKSTAESNINNSNITNSSNVRNYENEPNVQGSSNSNQVFMCYNNNQNSNTTAPSPSNDIVVSEAGSAVNVVIDQTGQRYLMQDTDLHVDQAKVNEHLIRQARYNEKGELVISDMPVDSASEKSESVDLSVSLESRLHTTHPTTVVTDPCPVCGDQVSGYHYGIFTCESCKGFFKRTVQNKKVFQCHRNSDCDVMRGNRKKCPACRFAKCMSAGMKIEAVRLDRTRGGRSCYDGCSPHGRPNKTFLDKKMTPKPKKMQPDYMKHLQTMELKLPSGESISGSHLMNLLQKTPVKQTPVVTPVVPPVLTEIMSMESLLSEDESSSEIPEKFGEGDQNFFLTFLQIAEVRLYKLVRWARNLPQFSAISTDDQILLLQNGWAELLIFNCCMRSVESRTEIFLPLGKTVDLEKARSISEGCEDIVQRMLDLTDQLRRLNVDQYEYVAMKVLVLITPDVKGMKENYKAREQQELISDALYKYTISHYPQNPDKFGEMLLRLPEITRVSSIGKELLNTLMPPGFQSCGLLFELLKGDGAAKEES
ncbi:nuclear hormone receptor FTZ-F1 beta-like [Mytilus galloprovincialis]|uniref:nuclear hormone receptor FTZ-F1 beta-like n=1 Tax=Mytilus galloprovincialis TaxID=29158 RepID=UPI003F7BF14D